MDTSSFVPNAGTIAASAGARSTRAKQQFGRAAREAAVAASTSTVLSVDPPGADALDREGSTAIVKRFVPRMVLETIIKRGSEVRDKPEITRYLAAVGFFDVSGFSKLAHELEATHTMQANKRTSSRKFELNGLSYKGAGAEELAEKLNRTLSGLISRILKHGGDIIKFAGDAILVVWQVSKEEELPRAVFHASSCAIQSCSQMFNQSSKRSIEGNPLVKSNSSTSNGSGSSLGGGEQSNGPVSDVTAARSKSLPVNHVAFSDHVSLTSSVEAHTSSAGNLTASSSNAKQVKKTKKKLGLHVGIGCGSLVACHVGGERKRWEFFIAGDSCLQANVAEGQAKESQVVLSKEALEMLLKMGPSFDSSVEYLALQSGYALLKSLPSTKVKINSRMYEQEMEKVMGKMNSDQLKAAQSYVPRTLIEAQGKGGTAVNGLRRLTVIFFKLSGVAVTEMDGQDDGKQFIEQAQHHVKMIQESAYKYYATLRQFILDDKGFVAIVVLGLPPFFHPDNASRALKVAACLINEKKVKATAGICTGTVFCGVIGSSQRAEYSVAGDCINLAAKLMTVAKPCTSLCDLETMEEARQNKTPYSFLPMPPVQVKGTQGETVQVFQPCVPEPRRRRSHKATRKNGLPPGAIGGGLLNPTNRTAKVNKNLDIGSMIVPNDSNTPKDHVRKANETRSLVDTVKVEPKKGAENELGADKRGGLRESSKDVGSPDSAFPTSKDEKGPSEPKQTQTMSPGAGGSKMKAKRPPPVSTSSGVASTQSEPSLPGTATNTSTEQPASQPTALGAGLSKLKAAAFIDSQCPPVKVAFIEGEAGSGKSHVLDQLVSSSSAQYVFVTSGDSTENQTPFYVWRDILQDVLDLGLVDGMESSMVNSPLPTQHKRLIGSRQSEECASDQALNSVTTPHSGGNFTGRRKRQFGRLSITRSQSYASSLGDLSKMRQSNGLQPPKLSIEDVLSSNTPPPGPPVTLVADAPEAAAVGVKLGQSRSLGVKAPASKSALMQTLFSDKAFEGLDHGTAGGTVDKLSPLTSFDGVHDVTASTDPVHVLTRSRSSTSSLLQSPRSDLLSKRRVSYAGMGSQPIQGSTLRHQMTFNGQNHHFVRDQRTDSTRGEMPQPTGSTISVARYQELVESDPEISTTVNSSSEVQPSLSVQNAGPHNSQPDASSRNNLDTVDFSVDECGWGNTLEYDALSQQSSSPVRHQANGVDVEALPTPPSPSIPFRIVDSVARPHRHSRSASTTPLGSRYSGGFSQASPGSSTTPSNYPGNMNGSQMWSLDSRSRRVNTRSRADSSSRFNVGNGLVFRLGSSQSHDTLSTLNESPILRRLRDSGKLKSSQLLALNRIIPSFVAHVDAESTGKPRGSSTLRKAPRRTSAGMPSTLSGLAPRRQTSVTSPEDDREAAIELMLSLLSEAGKFGTILIVIENAHNLDDDSWDLFERMLERDEEQVLEGNSVQLNVRFVVAYRPNWLDTENKGIRGRFERFTSLPASGSSIRQPSTCSSSVAKAKLRSLGSTANLPQAKLKRPHHIRSVSSIDSSSSSFLNDVNVIAEPFSLPQGISPPIPSSTPKGRDSTKQFPDSTGMQEVTTGLVHFFEMKPLDMRQCALLLYDQEELILTQELLLFLYKRSKGNPEALLHWFHRLVAGNHVQVDEATRAVSILTNLQDLDREGLSVTAEQLTMVHQALDALTPDAGLVLKLASVTGNRIPKLLLSWLYRRTVTKNRGAQQADEPPELEDDPLLEPMLQELRNSSFFHDVATTDFVTESVDVLKFNNEEERCILYGSILRQDRKTIHALIVQWFECHPWHQSLLAGPGHLGLHALLAENYSKAFDFFEDTVKQGIRQGRKSECLEYLDHCSEIVDKVTQEPDLMPMEEARLRKVRYHLLLAQYLITTHTWDEASKNLKRILRLCGREGYRSSPSTKAPRKRGMLTRFLLCCLLIEPDEYPPSDSRKTKKANMRKGEHSRNSSNVGVISMASEPDDSIAPAQPPGNAFDLLGCTEYYAEELERYADNAQALLDSLWDLQDVTNRKIKSVMKLSERFMDPLSLVEDTQFLSTGPLTRARRSSTDAPSSQVPPQPRTSVPSEPTTKDSGRFAAVRGIVSSFFG